MRFNRTTGESIEFIQQREKRHIRNSLCRHGLLPQALGRTDLAPPSPNHQRRLVPPAAMTVRATPARLRLILVDDHAVVREGLKRILAASASSWEISEASSGFQALELLRQQPCDLAIVDLSMPGMNGLELVHRIRDLFPSVLILVLSMHAEEQYAMRAFKSGAKGYVTKDTAAEELVAAVRKVASGGAYVTSSLAERVVQQLNGTLQGSPHAQLSDREFDVLQRIVAGQRLTDIAAALHLSIKTVSTHKARLLQKMNMSSQSELIRYAISHKLIDTGET